MEYVRLATTIENDNKDEIIDAIKQVFSTFLRENNLNKSLIKHVHITITKDIRSYNPSRALRESFNLNKAALFTSLEPDIIGSLEKAIRFLIVVDTNRELKNIYLRGAKNLRVEYAIND